METLLMERPNTEAEVIILNTLFAEIRKDDIQITEDQIAYISSHLLPDIRHLTSIFKNIIARAKFNDKIVSNEIIEEVFGILDVKKKPSLPLILKAVSDIFEVKKEWIVSRSRKKCCLVPRQVYFYLCKDILGTNIILKDIAKTANRNHSTVLHSIEKIERLIRRDTDLSDKINQIKNLLE